jgi:transcriptional regulator with XRE-family HTH domain
LGGQTVPTVAMIDAIAAALDLPPDYFIESQLRTISAELQTNHALRHNVYQRVVLAAATKPRRSVRG